MSTCSFIFLTLLLSVNCFEEPPTIIVIGAGPSGLAATTKLYKNNLTNIKILEAENRIGGRVHSVKFGDAFVDLGAEWCHGEGDNIVYDLVKDYNVLRHGRDDFPLVFYSNGEQISEDLCEDWLTFADSFTEVNDVLPGNVSKNCQNLSSVGECFQKQFQNVLLEKFKNNKKHMNMTKEAFDMMEIYLLSYESAFTLSDLSVKSEYKTCSGDQYLDWNGLGFKTALEVLMGEYPDKSKKLPLDDKILLNKEVVKINWNTTEGKTEVKCSDNSTFEADFLICTPSVGVLKADHDKIFNPSLPNEKVRSINGIGFGAVVKILLHFPVAWYGDNGFAFVWNSEDKRKVIDEYPHGPIKDGVSWITYLNLVYQAEYNPNVLVLWLTGPVIPELEKQSDEVVKNGCMFVIKKFLGKKFNVSEPDQILRTKWHSNPHFRGTYTYDSASGETYKNKYHEKLGTPLMGQNGKYAVLFAGEASHPHFFGTVHGAIEAGYREADRIIDLFNLKEA